MLTSVDVSSFLKEKLEELKSAAEDEDYLRKLIDKSSASSEQVLDLAIILSKQFKFFEASFLCRQCMQRDAKDMNARNFRAILYGLRDLDSKAIY